MDPSAGLDALARNKIFASAGNRFSATRAIRQYRRQCTDCASRPWCYVFTPLNIHTPVVPVLHGSVTQYCTVFIQELNRRVCCIVFYSVIKLIFSDN